MSRLDKVWLILPPSDAEDWVPASVFETSEQAVAVLRTDEKFDYKVEQISDNEVVVSADDSEGYSVHIVAVPIEYT